MPIRGNPSVSGDENGSLARGLGDQETIKRIAMMRREQARITGILPRHAEPSELLLLDNRIQVGGQTLQFRVTWPFVFDLVG